MKKRIVWLLALAVVSVFSLWLSKITVNLTTGVSLKVSGAEKQELRLYYDNLSNGPYYFEDSFSKIKNISGKKNKRVFISVPDTHLSKLRIDYDYSNQLQILDIRIVTGPFCIYKLSASDIKKIFTCKESVTSWVEDSIYFLNSLEPDPYIYIENLDVSMLEKNKRIYKGILFVWFFFLLFLIFKRNINTLSNIMSTKAVFIVVSIFLTCLPVVSSYFIIGYTKNNNENRALAPKPQLNIKTLKSFPAMYEAYFNDNLPYKNSLVVFNNFINTKLLATSSNKSVILGKNGWLFYDSIHSNDGDELGDYLGSNLYSSEELNNAVEQVINMKRFVEEKGAEFYLFIAPNKSTIYSEFMPSYYKKTEQSRVDQLVCELKKYPEINVVYAKDSLLEHKGEQPLYYKYDTHWNEYGGYIATQELLKGIGLKNQSIANVKLYEDKCYNKDLAKMMNLEKFYENDLSYRVLNYMPKVSAIETKRDVVTQSDYNSFFKSNSMDDRTLLFCRDSFGEATFEFLPLNFKNTIYIHRNLWKDDYLDEYHPDIFVFEFVERHSGVLPYFLQGDR